MVPGGHGREDQRGQPQVEHALIERGRASGRDQTQAFGQQADEHQGEDRKQSGDDKRHGLASLFRGGVPSAPTSAVPAVYVAVVVSYAVKA